MSDSTLLHNVANPITPAFRSRFTISYAQWLITAIDESLKRENRPIIFRNPKPKVDLSCLLNQIEVYLKREITSYIEL